MSYKITLRAARVNAGLKQTQAAEKLGVTRDTNSNWENGKNYPNALKIKEIEQVYGVSFDELRW